MYKNNRRDFLSKTLAIGAAAILPFTEESKLHEALPSLPSLKGRKILFTYGGWNGHEPEKFRDYMVPWMKEEGAEVNAFTTLDPYQDKSLMDSIDLVIQIFTMSQITDAQQNGLLSAVRN